MYKVMWICRFNKSMTREQAREHWRTTHAQLALKVPGMIGYVQNHCTETIGMDLPGGGSLIIDGVAEAWWRSEDEYDAAMSSPEWAALLEDGAINFDVDTMVAAVIDEYVMRPHPASD